MLPKMCRKLPCRNIEVKAVCQVAGWALGVPDTPGMPWQATVLTVPSRLRAVARSQWLPGCVSS